MIPPLEISEFEGDADCEAQCPLKIRSMQNVNPMRRSATRAERITISSIRVSNSGISSKDHVNREHRGALPLRFYDTADDPDQAMNHAVAIGAKHRVISDRIAGHLEP